MIDTRNEDEIYGDHLFDSPANVTKMLAHPHGFCKCLLVLTLDFLSVGKNNGAVDVKMLTFHYQGKPLNFCTI